MHISIPVINNLTANVPNVPLYGPYALSFSIVNFQSGVVVAPLTSPGDTLTTLYICRTDESYSWWTSGYMTDSYYGNCGTTAVSVFSISPVVGMANRVGIILNPDYSVLGPINIYISMWY